MTKKLLFLVMIAAAMAMSAEAQRLETVSDAAFAGQLDIVGVQAAGLVPWRNVAEDQLIARLSDKKPAVRRAALSKAKEMVVVSEAVRNKVSEMVLNRAELEDIRISAAKTLVPAAKYEKPGAALMSAGLSDASLAVRITACKALYEAAAESYEIKTWIIARLSENNQKMRLAAAWALFKASPQLDVQAELWPLYGNKEESAEIRTEALKSLFLAVETDDMHALTYMIHDVSIIGSPESVHVAGIMLLAADKNPNDRRDITNHIIKTQAHNAVIVAAAKTAAKGRTAEVEKYFHLGYKLSDGTYVAPIDIP
ncbi:MAG: hypothetical protein A2270_00160 [Elusimicrobia bacterium RIFOXYA12_FULL_51_18]|nr:MAG: hypothetical protein A2270_00160 [Elusimicrobia bacterium RIFOXYA12_FULL_51_18]OGS31509.1 MAG: hypothetical protein A2218_09630 [Elusimicrobia bacterium RIFOXYA2_FULL_53_38]